MTSTCKFCNKPIIWKKSKLGRAYPVNVDDESFHNCQEFKEKSPLRQTTLPERKGVNLDTINSKLDLLMNHLGVSHEPNPQLSN